MQNKTISFETAEAAVMQTWKSLLKQTNPYLVPILLPMIEHFKPLFQEFYDLGVSHGRTAQAVPEGFVLIKDDTKTVVAIERMVEQQVEASGMDSRRLERLDGWKIIEAAIKAQEPAND